MQDSQGVCASGIASHVLRRQSAGAGGVGDATLAKFGVVTLIAVPLCFVLGYGLRKLPGVRCVM
jgi:hypothetical protein